MKKLTQLSEGKYYIDNQRVIPILVYGPIMYTYNYTDTEHMELPINFLVEQIKTETNVDLEKIANSFHSSGIGVSHNGINTRHEIVMFFQSSPKPEN
jgi:hypothetical protein